MTVSAFRFLQQHFAAYRQRAKWPFLWRISIEGLLVPIVAAALLTVVFRLPMRTDLRGMTVWKLFATGVIVAPFVETLIFQSIPVGIGRALGWNFWGQLVISNALFALAHFPSGFSTGVSAGILGGFYTTFTYVHWRGTSFRSALWMTTGMHSLHNAVPILLMIAGRHLK